MHYKFHEYTGLGGFCNAVPWFRVEGVLYVDDVPTYGDAVYGCGDLTDDVRLFCREVITNNLSQFCQYDRPFSD